MAVLVTGAAGYIGSHMVLTLPDAGHDAIMALDDRSAGFDRTGPVGDKRVVGAVAGPALVWADKLGTRNRI